MVPIPDVSRCGCGPPKGAGPLNRPFPHDSRGAGQHSGAPLISSPIFHYRYGGLRLASNVALGQLRAEQPGSPEPEASLSLAVETGPLPVADTILYQWEGRYRLTLGRLGGNWLMASSLDGAFLIDVAGRSIRCFVGEPGDPAWLDIFVRRVLPRVAILFGATAIHAASAAIGGRALLLMGESGAGKSTLSAALGAAGWDMLSDDISILWHPTAPRVAPATTGTCVWPDSRIALGLADDLCAPMPGYDGKMRFVSGHDTATAPIPLTALVVLERGDGTEPVIERISAGEAMGLASRQRIRFNPVDPQGKEMLDTFAALGAVARVTPAYRLSRPMSYAALPAAIARLREVLEADHVL